jgi:hypothetical protein
VIQKEKCHTGSGWKSAIQRHVLFEWPLKTILNLVCLFIRVLAKWQNVVISMISQTYLFLKVHCDPTTQLSKNWKKVIKV